MFLRIIVAPMVAALLAGAAAALFWFGRSSDALAAALADSAALGSAFGACAVLTTVHFVVRWFRWHFLLRRFTRALRLRDSARLYFASVPLLMTPFALGELLRAVYLHRVASIRVTHVIATWFAERCFDVLTVIVLLTAAWGRGPLLLAVAALFACAFLAARRVQSRWSRALATAITATLSSLLVWSALAAALHLSALALGIEVSPVQSSRAFAEGTLWGGLTGVPLGGGVTGSVIIVELTRQGIAEPSAVVVTALFRIGTVWFGVALGTVILSMWRRELVAAFRRADAPRHFDHLAAHYPSLIPGHVRDRLVRRKTTRMVRVLREASIGSGSSGLDVGCGQGDHVRVLTAEGYRMTGVDESAGQLAAATTAAGVTRWARAAADALPFADRRFDFVYAINVLHHVQGSDARARALAEMVRVLRPGGVLFLHEMNTANPVFGFYMGYVFPMLRRIDDGTEEWILPDELPPVQGQHWEPQIEYFTFLPEFVPPALLRRFGALERWLERSRWRRYSAHFMATLIRR